MVPDLRRSTELVAGEHRYKRMETAPDKSLARQIRECVADANVTRQLKRLPLFLVPDDTPDMSQHPFDKLGEIGAKDADAT